MKHKEQKLWKILLRVFLNAAFAACFSVVLAATCEAVARQDLSTFWSFLETERGLLVIRNTALLAFVLMMALYFLTTRLWAAVALTGIPLLVCHMICYFKLTLRNEPFYPWDITLAGEATGILSSITLEPRK